MPRKFIIFGDATRDASDYHSSCFSGADLTCDWAPWEQVSRIDTCKADLLVLWPGGASPIARIFEMLKGALKGRLNRAPVLAILPEDADSMLIRTASESVDDFLISPVRNDELRERVERMLGPETGAEEVSTRLREELSAAGLIGRDVKFTSLLDRIPLAAGVPSPVLIVGETGTGKELIARAIHRVSSRRDFGFIPVDCASIPDHLFENELFGHSRGAFTDARTDRKGLIALANGGTLFLDEVDSLSAAAQGKLLRFLQERTYRPLGSDHFVEANVKLLAATNKDLLQLVEARQFRSDLFFRLNVLRLDLPPLRDRAKDISLLARHFTDMFCVEYGMERKTLSPAALRRLEEHKWPGNVRELYNVIQRALIFCNRPQLLPGDLDQNWTTPAAPAGHPSFRQARAQAIESFERRYVGDLLQACGGNVSQSARIAQKERRAFGRLVKRYQLKARTETIEVE